MADLAGEGSNVATPIAANRQGFTGCISYPTKGRRDRPNTSIPRIFYPNHPSQAQGLPRVATAP